LESALESEPESKPARPKSEKPHEQQSGPLLVHIWREKETFVYKTAERLTGIEIDLLNEIGKRFGKQIQSPDKTQAAISAAALSEKRLCPKIGNIHIPTCL
jgi:ABC-type amino acid transport substrate-binding protein